MHRNRNCCSSTVPDLGGLDDVRGGVVLEDLDRVLLLSKNPTAESTREAGVAEQIGARDRGAVAGYFGLMRPGCYTRSRCGNADYVGRTLSVFDFFTLILLHLCCLI